MSGGPKRRRNATKDIAEGQRRVQVVASYLLVVVGIALFAGGTILLIVTEDLSVYAMLCMEIVGVLTLLVGLKKIRDLRRDEL